MKLDRREFLLASGCLVAAGLVRAEPPKGGLGLVRSCHGKLAGPASTDAPLDYPKVRDMVWKAIEYGAPRAGSLEAKIKPGAWVVLKPNIAFLGSQDSYRSGDISDFRVTQAVLEYIAIRSKARRITIAEGGSYQAAHSSGMWEISQNGVRVDARTFDWGEQEFPGWSGTLEGMLREFARRFPETRFDYVNLNLDAMRDASGAFRSLEVPRAGNGVGAFGARSTYCPTNTIHSCDFLINIPVMKIHADCGITACLKNYVGTAPREVYAPSWRYSNRILHDEYSVEGRIDGWVVDLASFHPADFNVVDGIRGLQYSNHNNNKPDQMLRNNMVLAGEDAVALDSLVAQIMGFNPWDFEFLHMAAAREMGTMDLGRVEVRGDDPGQVARPWAKNSQWHGRCNREWMVSRNPAAPGESWKKVTILTDTLYPAKVVGDPDPGTTYAAAVRVRAEGNRKCFLWAGGQGRLEASVNGARVIEEDCPEAGQVGRIKVPVELKAGENLLEFHVRSLSGTAQVSALLSGPKNDGDTVDGIRYLA
jgi:uncharacterized protein (DUF362 family)